MTKTLELPGRDSARIFASLKSLADSCGEASKHDIVTVLILGCLSEGINTRSGVIGMVTHLGYNNKHVAIMLKEGAGPHAEGYSWHRDALGRYHPWA